MKSITRETRQRTKTRRRLKTKHCLTFVFPAENETLDPILLGLRTSSSCISLSMLKVRNITQNLLCLIHKVTFQFLFPTNCLQNIYFFNNKINNTVALLGMIIRCRKRCRAHLFVLNNMLTT